MLAAALGIGALVAVYAFLIEPEWVEWHDEAVAIPGLPPELDGLRICQLSDLHAGGGASQAYLGRVIRECNAWKPDVVVLTGDLVNRRAREIPICMAALKDLKAPRGIFAILGGHDYQHQPEMLVEALRKAGIRLLRNEAVALESPSGRLWIAGMDDNSGAGRASLKRTLQSVPPGSPVLLLMHSPDSILDAAARGVHLVLAGHTHGGQVCLPFYGAIRTMSRFGRRFVSGRFHVQDTVMYVCRGIGSHHHLRFLARPEAVRITLGCAPAAARTGCSGIPQSDSALLPGV